MIRSYTVMDALALIQRYTVGESDAFALMERYQDSAGRILRSGWNQEVVIELIGQLREDLIREMLLLVKPAENLPDLPPIGSDLMGNG